MVNHWNIRIFLFYIQKHILINRISLKKITYITIYQYFKQPIRFLQGNG